MYKMIILKKKKKDKENVVHVVVEEKREWDIMAKIYFTFFIIFVALVTYIMIYRHINRDQIIENVKNNEKNIVVENTID